MLPYILAGAAALALGKILADSASRENSRARKRYEVEYNTQSRRLNNYAKHARKKYKLDTLFKMKKAKIMVADTLYDEYKNTKKQLKELNKNIFYIKNSVEQLFKKKHATTSREEKKAIQNEINELLTVKKDFFRVRDNIKLNVDSIQEKLRLANSETRMIQEKINIVLSN